MKRNGRESQRNALAIYIAKCEIRFFITKKKKKKKIKNKKKLSNRSEILMQ